MTRMKHPDLTLPTVRRALALVLLAGVVTFTACSDSTPAAVEAPTDAASAKPDEVFMVVEQMPELVGGLQSLAGSIRYPAEAKEAGIEGRVLVEFVVDETGAIIDPHVVSGIGGGCDEEAVRAIESATFTPGMQRGVPVAVKLTLPISFRLQ